VASQERPLGAVTSCSDWFHHRRSWLATKRLSGATMSYCLGSRWGSCCACCGARFNARTSPSSSCRSCAEAAGGASVPDGSGDPGTTYSVAWSTRTHPKLKHQSVSRSRRAMRW
jgi:hypothetical protein